MMKVGLKKTLANAVIILTVSSLLFGFAAVRGAAAELKPAISIWVEPQQVNITTGSYHTGDKFNVTVWTNTYQNASYADVFTWQASMNFNSSLLTVVRVGYTNGSKSDFFSGHNTVPVEPVISASNAYTGESCIGTDSRAPGNGSLCWFELQIAAEPAGNETLTGTFNINNTDTYLLGNDLSEITSTKYDAQYNYSPPPPDVTPPTIGSVTRDPSDAQVAENTQVNVTATITDEVGGSGVKNATVSYTVDNSTYTDVNMSLSGAAWTCIIPGQLNGTTVHFRVTAYDNAGNMATMDGYDDIVYNYYVIPEFTAAILIAMLAVLAAAMIVYRKKFVRIP
jgi:hypothetical protein